VPQLVFLLTYRDAAISLTVINYIAAGDITVAKMNNSHAYTRSQHVAMHEFRAQIILPFTFTFKQAAKLTIAETITFWAHMQLQCNQSLQKFLTGSYLAP